MESLGGRIRYHGYLGEEELSRLLAECDIGIVPMEKESFVGIPYKLADYARASVAVVSSLGGESESLLSRYGAGAAYEALSPESFAAAVDALAARLPEAKAAAFEMARREFDSERIYRDYAAFALAVASEKKGGDR
jgi:glycosyltransferase involved in cell wall biosynthesis